ncbi:hypothetical protein Val02_25830 [Virgisporangium aliadipatigenens]|uniref:Uncharacterized protein n=1 Tax=Virgisporangium aliadipatigenens TaxID=741659 RepID=A0A8J3YK16_9ACTN|nr:hypothetical protein [Virgisporangium aliadipatigenens]GIJ45697.1 hypothetical protein Val02_25830 [Virgisporangium aliadipatigenens]
MSDDYSGYEDDPTAHDGYDAGTPDTSHAFGGADVIGQPFGEIGGYGQEGHDDTTTYPAEGTDEQPDPYANESEAQADPYASEGQQAPFGGGYEFGQQQDAGYADQQPASEADPYATDQAAAPAEGRDSFHTGQPAS